MKPDRPECRACNLNEPKVCFDCLTHKLNHRETVAILVKDLLPEIILEGRSGGWMEDSPLDNKVISLQDRVEGNDI